MEAEDANNLLLRCPFARAIWDGVLEHKLNLS